MIYLILAIAIGWIATKTWDGHARWRYLVDRFGEEAARRIQLKEIWQGETAEMVEQTFGKPLEVKESVLKATVKHTYCYQRVAKNRFALRVHIENGAVVGWDR